MKKNKKGDLVEIYGFPGLKEKYEGMAKLRRRVGHDFVSRSADCNGEILETWEVVFIEDGFISYSPVTSRCIRNIINIRNYKRK